MYGFIQVYKPFLKAVSRYLPRNTRKNKYKSEAEDGKMIAFPLRGGVNMRKYFSFNCIYS